MTDLDLWIEFAGLDLSDEDRAALLKPWRTIAAEIAKLRSLDLTDVHPVIVFDATSGWPE